MLMPVRLILVRCDAKFINLGCLVSFITVKFHLGYLISLTHSCFIAFLSTYVVLIDVLIYAAAQLQESLINLLTYLLTYCLMRYCRLFITSGR